MAEDKEKVDESTKTKPWKCFQVEILRFTQEVESLTESFPKVMGMANATRGQTIEEFTNFLEANASSVREEGTKKQFILEGEAATQSIVLDRAARNSTLAYKLLHRSFLTSLVSVYDSFLGRLIAQIFYTKPELLNSSEKQMSFGELIQFKTMDEARDFLIEKEVEAIIRKNHSDHFAWLEKALGIPLRDGLEVWPLFIEVTERRNLFVHCDGVVSTQYLTVCKQHKSNVESSIVVGTQLGISRAYLEPAFEGFYEIGVKLAQVVWRKLLPETLNEADSNLNNVCYDLLLRKQYKLAKKLLEFACCVLKKHSSEELRRYFILNRAQACKWLGDEEATKKILNAEDWSACADKLKLAQAVLLDDIPRAVELMASVKADENFPNAYKDWPLFQKFRKTPEFLTNHEKVYGVPFAVKQVTQTQSSSSLDTLPAATDSPAGP